MFVCLSVCLFVCKLFFSVKDFSATTWVRILKFGTKLHSDKLYCVTKKTALYCLSVPLNVHFSFSLMEISVTDFSAPTGASVFKFCVHLKVGKVYCEMEIKMLILILPSFFNFSFFHSYNNTYGHFFCQRFLSNCLSYDSEIWYKA